MRLFVSNYQFLRKIGFRFKKPFLFKFCLYYIVYPSSLNNFGSEKAYRLYQEFQSYQICIDISCTILRFISKKSKLIEN